MAFCKLCNSSTDINGLWFAQLDRGSHWIDYCLKCKPKEEIKSVISNVFDCCGKLFNNSEFRRAVAYGDSRPIQRYCKDCVSGNGPAMPDVYFGKEYINGAINYEENIADPKTGKPIPFYDKQSKAAAMKQAGVREAGDKVHGARNEETLKAGKTKYFL